MTLIRTRIKVSQNVLDFFKSNEKAKGLSLTKIINNLFHYSTVIKAVSVNPEQKSLSNLEKGFSSNAKQLLMLSTELTFENEYDTIIFNDVNSMTEKELNDSLKHLIKSYGKSVNSLIKDSSFSDIVVNRYAIALKKIDKFIDKNLEEIETFTSYKDDPFLNELAELLTDSLKISDSNNFKNTEIKINKEAFDTINRLKYELDDLKEIKEQLKAIEVLKSELKNKFNKNILSGKAQSSVLKSLNVLEDNLNPLFSKCDKKVILNVNDEYMILNRIKDLKVSQKVYQKSEKAEEIYSIVKVFNNQINEKMKQINTIKLNNNNVEDDLNKLILLIYKKTQEINKLIN